METFERLHTIAKRAVAATNRRDLAKSLSLAVARVAFSRHILPRLMREADAALAPAAFARAVKDDHPLLPDDEGVDDGEGPEGEDIAEFVLRQPEDRDAYMAPTAYWFKESRRFGARFQTPTSALAGMFKECLQRYTHGKASTINSHRFDLDNVVIYRGMLMRQGTATRIITLPRASADVAMDTSFPHVRVSGDEPFGNFLIGRVMFFFCYNHDIVQLLRTPGDADKPVSPTFVVLQPLCFTMHEDASAAMNTLDLCTVAYSACIVQPVAVIRQFVRALPWIETSAAGAHVLRGVIVSRSRRLLE